MFVGQAYIVTMTLWKRLKSTAILAENWLALVFQILKKKKKKKKGCHQALIGVGTNTSASNFSATGSLSALIWFLS